MVELVRRAVFALYGEEYGKRQLSENLWQNLLEFAFLEALLMRMGDAASHERNRAPDVKSGDLVLHVDAENGGSDGRTILPWIRAQCSLPEALTADRINAALKVATLALRGGGRTKRRNWRLVVRELIEDVERQTRLPAKG